MSFETLGCSCDGPRPERRRAETADGPLRGLDPVGHSRPLQPAGVVTGNEGMMAVTHSTMSAVTDDLPLTIDPEFFSVSCWKQEGSKGCPDIQGAGVGRFESMFRGEIMRIVDRLAASESARASRRGDRTTRAQVATRYMGYRVQVTHVGGKTEQMTVNELLAAVAPCKSTRELYTCENPNYVTDARADVVGTTVDACAEAAKRRADAEAGAKRIAESRNCPNNPNTADPKAQHCPTKEVHSDVKWGLQLALKTKNPEGGNVIVRVGGIVTISVDCLVPGAVTGPGTRQPGDPTPPVVGGGTPTPPGGGGGTPTPPGGGEPTQGGGLGGVGAEPGRRSVGER